MSIALLKNFLFPRVKHTQRRQRDGTTDVDGITPGAMPAFVPSTETPSNKDSDISLLKTERSAQVAAPENVNLAPAPPDKGMTMLQTKEVAVDLESQGHSDRPTLRKRIKEMRQGFKLSPRMISDAIIGISDGMTVPFALTAGLASLGTTRIVIMAGLAELVAGAISMGLGGFIGAKSEAESYRATVAATQKMIDETPSDASAIVYEVFKPYRLSSTAVDNVVRSLHESASNMLDFLMRFHHQGAEPEKSRPLVCAITISMGYFIGGLIPLIPYFFVKPNEVMLALYWSIGVMGIALFAFGWVKTGVVIGWRGRANMLAALKGALQMTMIGGVAAGASVGLVRAMHD